MNPLRAFLFDCLQRCSNERFVVVVSAEEGVTDALELLARGILEDACPRTLDLLSSTGETRSVALLTFWLQRLGVNVVGLNIHETGLRLVGICGFPDNVALVQDGILRAVTDSPMLRHGSDRHHPILRPRGSGLTAVLLAIILPPWESLCETAGRWCWRD